MNWRKGWNSNPSAAASHSCVKVHHRPVIVHDFAHSIFLTREPRSATDPPSLSPIVPKLKERRGMATDGAISGKPAKPPATMKQKNQGDSGKALIPMLLVSAITAVPTIREFDHGN